MGGCNVLGCLFAKHSAAGSSRGSRVRSSRRSEAAAADESEATSHAEYVSYWTTCAPAHDCETVSCDRWALALFASRTFDPHILTPHAAHASVKPHSLH